MRRLYTDWTFLMIFTNSLFSQKTIKERDKRVHSRPRFALPSSTFLQHQGFRVGCLQKVRRGNADVPHENAVVGTKCWNVVQMLGPVAEKMWKVVPSGKPKSLGLRSQRFFAAPHRRTAKHSPSLRKGARFS